LYILDKIIWGKIMTPVEFDRKIKTEKPGKALEFQALINEGAGIGSLDDPQYVRSMEMLFRGLAAASLVECRGRIPTDAVNTAIEGYLAARREKIPDFKAMEDAEKGGGGVIGAIGSFLQRIRQAFRQGSVPERTRDR
jgi:hypothetical protein